MLDLSSLTRGQTHVPCVGRQILNRWTTREVLLGALSEQLNLMRLHLLSY